MLDVHFVSELRRARDRSYFASQRLADLFISTVTFAAIRFGIEAVGNPRRRVELHDWLLHRVRLLFDQRPGRPDDVKFRWRLLVAECRKAGHAFSQPDLFMAATALQRGLKVVDTVDYQLAKVSMLTPWVGECWRLRSQTVSMAKSGCNQSLLLVRVARLARGCSSKRNQPLANQTSISRR